MSIEINLQNILVIVIALVGAFWALLKLMAMQYEKGLETRFKGLAESMTSIKTAQATEQATTQRLERELLQFKAELPKDYVRREDFIRAIATIETKIDNMALRVERAVLSGKGGDL
jgi:chromosome segregation ATPase